MSYMFRSDAAEVRASADRLRQQAALVGDEATASKLLRLADDLEAWASRQEQIAGDNSTPYDGIGADVGDISAERSRPTIRLAVVTTVADGQSLEIIRDDRVATGDGAGDCQAGALPTVLRTAC